MSNELFRAIEQHDIAAVAAALSAGVSPNELESDASGWTPLHTAIDELDEGGSIEVLRMLLAHGADVNGWDGQFEATPLLMAMFRNNMEALRLLLDAGADPNAVSGEGEATLRWAAEHNDVEMAALFIRFGAGQSINSFGGFSRSTPLGLAVHALNLPMIEILLDAGADPEAVNDDGEPPIDLLPPRAKSDLQVWDRAMQLLAPRRP